MKVAIFGSTGMLGRAVTQVLRSSDNEIVTVGRENSDIEFDVSLGNLQKLGIDNVDYVVNCIGLISHIIQEVGTESFIQAASINSVFPNELAAFAEKRGIRIIQIATDCVFSGQKGQYVESSPHDATDIYGLSKSLGEVHSPFVMNIRTSIVGLEGRGFNSLLEWVLGQPKNASIYGFTDRTWNGITTLAFARIVRGIIDSNLFEGKLQHLVPSDSTTKAALVRLMATAFGRDDIMVTEKVSGAAKNLTLATEYPETNLKLWRSAGYSVIPSIEELIWEISDHQ